MTLPGSSKGHAYYSGTGGVHAGIDFRTSYYGDGQWQGFRTVICLSDRMVSLGEGWGSRVSRSSGMISLWEFNNIGGKTKGFRVAVA